MDIAIGRAPPLSDGQMQGHLRKEAHHLVQEFREHNKQACQLTEPGFLVSLDSSVSKFTNAAFMT